MVGNKIELIFQPFMYNIFLFPILKKIHKFVICWNFCGQYLPKLSWLHSSNFKTSVSFEFATNYKIILIKYA